jgi:hypothetical protein
MSLDVLVPLPALKTRCGQGVGLAVCPTLGLLVTSKLDDTLSVFALPSGCPITSDVAPMGDHHGVGAGAGAGLARVCILGGAGSPATMQFEFHDGSLSGCLAFTGPPTSRLLLVTDAGHDAVHVIDVAGRAHVGYVAAPGTIAGPRGVAATPARGSLGRQCALVPHCFLQTSAVTTMSLSDLVPLPALKTRCGLGVGLAVCPTLGLLVTSESYPT